MSCLQLLPRTALVDISGTTLLNTNTEGGLHSLAGGDDDKPYTIYRLELKTLKVTPKLRRKLCFLLKEFGGMRQRDTGVCRG